MGSVLSTGSEAWVFCLHISSWVFLIWPEVQVRNRHLMSGPWVIMIMSSIREVLRTPVHDLKWARAAFLFGSVWDGSGREDTGQAVFPRSGSSDHGDLEEVALKLRNSPHIFVIPLLTTPLHPTFSVMYTTNRLQNFCKTHIEFKPSCNQEPWFALYTRMGRHYYLCNCLLQHSCSPPWVRAIIAPHVFTTTSSIS